MSLSSASVAQVTISHTARSMTQIASDQVRNTDDGDTVRIGMRATFGDALNGFVYFETNQFDDTSLRTLVTRAEAVGREMLGWKEQIHVRTWDEQDTYANAKLWSPSTIGAFTTARQSVVPQIIDTVHDAGFLSSGFVSVMARAEAVLTDSGTSAYSEETDCEVSVTARPSDATTSGWSGVATRDWGKIDPTRIAKEAVEIAARNLHPQALEPGRRTAILGPGAVVQLMRFFAFHFDGGASDMGDTGFSKVPHQMKGSRFKEHMFDPRVKISSDPSDPDGGFRPWFAKGYANHPTTWVEGGYLKNLAYGLGSLDHGKEYAETPFGFRLHGGDTTIDQMIAQCDEGIYVNRFSSVDTIDWSTGMTTGATRDGCFLIKHGKIDRPVKNFRFLTSPFFLLNNIIAIGPSQRAAYGYAPWTVQEKVRSEQDWESELFQWPRRPMVVPPLMARDFNFNALIDAV